MRDPGRSWAGRGGTWRSGSAPSARAGWCRRPDPKPLRAPRVAAVPPEPGRAGRARRETRGPRGAARGVRAGRRPGLLCRLWTSRLQSKVGADPVRLPPQPGPALGRRGPPPPTRWRCVPASGRRPLLARLRPFGGRGLLRWRVLWEPWGLQTSPVAHARPHASQGRRDIWAPLPGRDAVSKTETTPACAWEPSEPSRPRKMQRGQQATTLGALDWAQPLFSEGWGAAKGQGCVLGPEPCSQGGLPCV